MKQGHISIKTSTIGVLLCLLLVHCDNTPQQDVAKQAESVVQTPEKPVRPVGQPKDTEPDKDESSKSEDPVIPEISKKEGQNNSALIRAAWINIEGGTYMMGSPDGSGEHDEHPLTEQTVKTIDVLKTEVTVGQYQKCVESHFCWETEEPDSEHYCNYGKKERVNNPINCIDYRQSVYFCAWIGGRLPTEAEWEYIARSGGKDYQYPWGNEPEASCDNAVLDTKEGIGCGAWVTWDVCSKPKGNSDQGVCDLSGNVIEWISDWYRLRYDRGNMPLPNIKNLKTGHLGHNRVMRGGGIGSDESLRSRNRIYHAPHFQYGGLGVRCVRDTAELEKSE